MADERSSELLRPLALSTVEFSGNIFLAPMAGWTDVAFRSVCIHHGAYFTYTEMVSAEAIIRDNEKTLSLLTRAQNEKNLGIQIFASESRSAASAVSRLNRFNPTLIDLNCGCPIHKICKTGAGASLLRDPLRIREMVRAMCNETDAPVTVKIRSGWDEESRNFMEVSEMAVEGGASLVCLHPRTRSQLFMGSADWNELRMLKRVLPVPLVGSGDVFHPQDIQRMFVETGCDGVMVARGALGNPFVFEQTENLLRGLPPKGEIHPFLRFETALQQLGIAIKMKGEKTACREMRKQFCAYSKGIRGSALLRSRIVKASTFCEYKEIIDGYLKNHGCVEA
jgi:nifR3 family TIM-barrel protein